MSYYYGRTTGRPEGGVERQKESVKRVVEGKDKTHLPTCSVSVL